MIDSKASRILRLPEVLSRVGISRSSLYLWIEEGHFPKQVPLGAKAVGWLETDIEMWIEERVREAACRSES